MLAMKRSNRAILILVLTAFSLFAGRYGCFYLGKYQDRYRQPWAYGPGPLLVGRWEGVCMDPDGQPHRVYIDIDEPMTDQERWKRLGRPHRKKGAKSDPRFFDGAGVVENAGRRDSCRIWGALEQADGQALHFQIRPLKEPATPGFNLKFLKGRWTGEQINLSVDFVWIKPDGSSFSDSADPRYSTQGQLALHRVR